MHSPHVHNIQKWACPRRKEGWSWTQLNLREGHHSVARIATWGQLTQSCSWVSSVLCYWVRFVLFAFPINMDYSLWGPSVCLFKFIFPHTWSPWSTHTNSGLQWYCLEPPAINKLPFIWYKTKWINDEEKLEVGKLSYSGVQHYSIFNLLVI